MEPAIEITKSEPCDNSNVEYMNSNVVHPMATHNHQQIEQIDAMQQNTVHVELKTLSKRLLFEKYFRIIAKDGNKLTTVCRLCKNNFILMGDFEIRSKFTLHLRVSTTFFSNEHESVMSMSLGS